MKPRHLSPSALDAFDWCPPHRYVRSYRDGAKMTAVTPVWYGSAVHTGLEAAFRGQDWEIEFLRAWRVAQGELDAVAATDLEESQVDRSGYSARGLFLIQSALALGVTGDPEVAFTETLDGLAIPVKGRIDMVDRERHIITDWKTSQRGWSAAMVAKKVWQPAIYGAVYAKQYGVQPTFQYAILPVMGSAPAYLLQAPRTPESQVAAIARAQQILERIWADDWGDCTCPAWSLKKKGVAVA